LLARARIAGFHKQSAAREALLRRAAEAGPANYKVHIALAQFLIEGGGANLSGAEAQARIATNLDPGRVDAYAVLAVIYAERGAWDELDLTLTTALREVPDDFSPHYRAAERLVASGCDPVRAERYLRLYLTQEPEGNQPSVADARWQLGMALRAQGRDVHARAEFKESVRLDPESKAAQELRRSRTAHPLVMSNTAGSM